MFTFFCAPAKARLEKWGKEDNLQKELNDYLFEFLYFRKRVMNNPAAI
jgi:hypothetical protein